MTVPTFSPARISAPMLVRTFDRFQHGARLRRLHPLNEPYCYTKVLAAGLGLSPKN